jgi:hypothetical protein
MRRLIAGLVAALVLSSPPLFADKPDKSGKTKGKSKGQDAAVVVTFTVGQRDKAQAYFVEKHGRGGCPPGLAKKNNGCLPPGQAKKRYTVGYALPKGIETHPLPADLSIRIGAPPAGYGYFMVDGDLVKLAVGTMLVVDAIAGLVD